MTSTRTRAAASLGAALLLAGAAAPTFGAARDEAAAQPQLLVAADEALEEAVGLDLLLQDGKLAGIGAGSAQDSPVVRTVQHDGHMVVTADADAAADAASSAAADAAAVLTDVRVVDVTAAAAGTQALVETVSGDTTLLAPAALTDAENPSPDYCRDPANANPTAPAPGKVPVTIDVVDRRGESGAGRFTLMDFHCEPYEANGYIAFGVDPGQERTFYLPPGTYSMIGEVTTADASGQHPEEVTFGGDPEFTVSAGEPMSITVDARDGEPLTLTTPRPSAQSVVVLGWLRGVEGNAPLMSTSIVFPQGSTVSQVSVIPSEQVTDGVFGFYPWIRSSEPWAEATVRGVGEPLELDVRHLNPLDAPAVEGPASLHVGLDGAGPGDVVMITDSADLDQDIATAEAAGARAVLVAPAGAGQTDPWVRTRMPVLTLPADDAALAVERTRATGGTAPMTLKADLFVDYNYDLIDEYPTIVSDPFPGLGEEDLTAVEQHFVTDGASMFMMEARSPHEPCRCLLAPIFDVVEPGSTRTDYVIDNGSTWQQQVSDTYALNAKSAVTAYPKDTTRPTNRWFGGQVGSGLPADIGATQFQAPATTADGTMRFRLAPTDGDGHALAGRFTRAGAVARDGVVVEPSFSGNAVLESEGEADWHVELRTSHLPSLWQSSSTVTSVWSFTAAVNDGSTPQALPLVDMRATYPVDEDSRRVPGGQVVVTPWRLDGADTARASVVVEISRDGGVTWKRQPVRAVGDSWVATPVPGSGPVDLQVTVRGADGSSLVRTVENAWTD